MTTTSEFTRKRTEAAVLQHDDFWLERDPDGPPVRMAYSLDCGLSKPPGAGDRWATAIRVVAYRNGVTLRRSESVYVYETDGGRAYIGPASTKIVATNLVVGDPLRHRDMRVLYRCCYGGLCASGSVSNEIRNAIHIVEGNAHGHVLTSPQLLGAIGAMRLAQFAGDQVSELLGPMGGKAPYKSELMKGLARAMMRSSTFRLDDFLRRVQESIPESLS